MIRKGLRLWVDILCINQNDPIERNEHILRMGSIYQHAKHVIYWLGDETHNSNQAFDHITSIAEAWRKNSEDRWHFSLPDRRPELCLPPVWLSILDIMQRPFWRRVWIKQELAMGKLDTPLLCGQKAIAWGELYEAVYLATYQSVGYIEHLLFQHTAKSTASSRSPLTTDPLRRIPLYQLNTLREKLTQLSEIEQRETMLAHRMPSILDFSRSSEATDPRDKVYAIASLLSTPVTKRMRVNYEWPVELVYTSFTKAVIEATQSLDILDYSILNSNRSTPTWVPDWRLDKHTRIFSGIKTRKPYRASGILAAVAQFSEIDPHILSVNGYQVDVLDGLARSTESSSSSSTTNPSSRHQLFQSTGFTSAYGTSSTAIRDALWRTYTADINRNGDPAPGSFERILDLWDNAATETLATDPKSAPSNSSNELMQRRHLFQKILKNTSELFLAGLPIREYLSSQPSSSPTKAEPANRKLTLESALERVYTTSLDRRLATTRDRGYLCMVPDVSLPGDVVCVLYGCSLPVVLRQDPATATKWDVVGTCYCHGISQGEAVDLVETGQLKKQTFVLR
jgi:hypothetical protein